MRHWRSLVTIIVAFALLCGVTYGAFAYGHHTGFSSGYNKADTRDTTAFKKQLAIQKKKDDDTISGLQLQNGFLTSTANSLSAQATRPPSCTSYRYGIDNNYTDTTCY